MSYSCSFGAPQTLIGSQSTTELCGHDYTRCVSPNRILFTKTLCDTSESFHEIGIGRFCGFNFIVGALGLQRRRRKCW